MNWSSSSNTWSLCVSVNGTDSILVRTRLIFISTGYYDYHTPLQVEIPGMEDFKGTVVHPQFWPSSLEYSSKRVVIIGSGATAITLLPSLTKKAAHVTMLQRSPGYVMSIPQRGAFEAVTTKILPRRVAQWMIRLRWTLLSFMLVTLCQRFPKPARRYFLRATAKQLPPEMSVDPDFMPSYNPWQQRMCMCPDGDFFASLRSGKSSIKTGVIDKVTETSIRLRSGEELHPDIIVTATGLKLRMAGGIEISIDGEAFDISRHYAWNSAMIEGLPNAVFALGYVDASWTLGADATAQLAMRLLKRMKRDGAAAIVPRISAQEKDRLRDRPFLALSSTYVERGKNALPRAGNVAPWQPRSYYWKDLATAKWGNIQRGLEWVHGGRVTPGED